MARWYRSVFLYPFGHCGNYYNCCSNDYNSTGNDYNCTGNHYNSASNHYNSASNHYNCCSDYYNCFGDYYNCCVSDHDDSFVRHDNCICRHNFADIVSCCQQLVDANACATKNCLIGDDPCSTTKSGHDYHARQSSKSNIAHLDVVHYPCA